MDQAFQLLLVLGLATIGMIWIGLPIWLASHSRRLRTLEQASEERTGDRDPSRDLTHRVVNLEAEIRTLRAALDIAKHPPQSTQEVPARATPVPANIAAKPPAGVIPIPKAPPVFAPAPPPEPAIPVAAAVAVVRSVPVVPAVPVVPVVPVETAVASKPLEERVIDWLTKFGAVIVFLGLAAAASYFWNVVSVWGRVGIFAAAGAGMLAAGIRLEKQDRYLILGRSLVGGGWATLFMTAFGMHHVAAIRVIQSLELDLFVVLAVTAAMAWDTLRYNSQFVTGLAFGLGFFTVTQSHDSPWSLLANVMLAGGLIFIVLRRKWYELEVFGLLASYGTHVLWVRPVVEAGGPFGESRVVLTLYWLAFRASYLGRDITDAREESVSSLAAILNTVLLVAVAYYQSTFNRMFGFWALLTLGLIELGSAQLPRIRQARRVAFLVTSSLGCLLVLAAVPIRFVASPRVIFWLLASQAFLFVGIFAREVLFRRFGLGAALLAGLYEAFSRGVPLISGPVLHGLSPRDTPLGLLFGVIALVLYVNAHAVTRRWPALFVDEDAAGASLLSHVAALNVALAIYVAVPTAWTGVSMAAAACLWAFVASRFRLAEMAHQGHLLAAIACFDVVAVNAGADEAVRTITFAAVASLFYVSSLFTRRADESLASGPLVSGTYTFAGTALLGFLAYLETHDWRTAVAWAILALALGAAGKYLKREELRWQAVVLGAFAFSAALFVNMQVPGTLALAGRIPVRLASVSGVAAILYLLQRYAPVASIDFPVGALESWAGSLLVSWLLWYELPPTSVALAWAMFGLMLLEIGLGGDSEGRRQLRVQAYVAVFAAFGHVLIANINSPDTMWYTTLPIAPLLFFMYWRLQDAASAKRAGAWAARMTVILAWLGSATVYIVMKFLLPPDFVVIGWAAASAAVALVTFVTGRRVFLDQALVGVAPVVFRGLMHNVYETHLSTLGSSAGIGLIAASVVLLLPLPVLFRLRDTHATGDGFARLRHRPEQVFFFAATTLVTVVFAYLLPGVSMTLAWGLEATAIFVLALAVGERSFRLSGIGLLLVCAVKIVGYDVWHFSDTISRIVTLTAVGAILLGVSFLYGRYRERIRELL